MPKIDRRQKGFACPAMKMASDRSNLILSFGSAGDVVGKCRKYKTFTNHRAVRIQRTICHGGLSDDNRIPGHTTTAFLYCFAGHFSV